MDFPAKALNFYCFLFLYLSSLLSDENTFRNFLNRSPINYENTPRLKSSGYPFFPLLHIWWISMKSFVSEENRFITFANLLQKEEKMIEWLLCNIFTLDGLFISSNVIANIKRAAKISIVYFKWRSKKKFLLRKARGVHPESC